MPHGNFKHGYTSKNRLYRIWHNMKARCYNPNFNKYKYYGGKGIIVCDEWRTDFLKFRDWALNNGYADNLTIDRIDSNKNYCPENCRWITLTENTLLSNKTNRKYKAISPNGTEYILNEFANFCREHNLNKGVVSLIINNKSKSNSTKGWVFEEIN